MELVVSIHPAASRRQDRGIIRSRDIIDCYESEWKRQSWVCWFAFYSSTLRHASHVWSPHRDLLILRFHDEEQSFFHDSENLHLKFIASSSPTSSSDSFDYSELHAFVTAVGDILLPFRLDLNHGAPTSESHFVPTPVTTGNIRSLTLAICLGLPVLLEGDSGPTLPSVISMLIAKALVKLHWLKSLPIVQDRRISPRFT